MNRTNSFDVVFGIDMETDIGSFTPFYTGVKYGTPRILSVFKKHDVRSTFYWTGHAAAENPAMVKKAAAAGHETGCHGLVHETLGDAIFPLPNNWPVCKWEVEGRINEATKIVAKTAGTRPKSFRCPRLWGSSSVIKALVSLGYTSDASLPLYFYKKPFVPYRPAASDWTKPGKLPIIEIPNFCDLAMKSSDPYGRDRDQWPLFRTKSADALIKKVDSFTGYVRARGERPVVCFYFHPWEFHEMPRGALDFGEASVTPRSFITQNCGTYAVTQLDRLCGLLKERGASFCTAGDIAKGKLQVKREL